MKFKINGRTWVIKEAEQEVLAETQRLKRNEYQGSYYGITQYSKQIIYLWKELCEEQKRQTLIHELTHCYIGMYQSYNREDRYDEEEVCDLVSNALYIINDIVEKYFKENK